MTKFDVQDVVIILRTGTYLNTAGVVAMINVFENVYFKDLVDPNVSWLIGDASVIISGANAGGVLATDIIYMQGSKDKDPEGLKGIVKSKANLVADGKEPYGITATRKWSSVENSASSASISTDLLNKLMLDVEKKCGKAPNLLITSYKQYEKILNVLEDQKRYSVNTRAGLKSKSGADISFSGVEFMSSAGPVGIFPERFCDDDRVYALIDIGDLENNVFEGDKKCECGSEKVNSNKHSSWCPKYDS
jgi:hypothetical protein